MTTIPESSVSKVSVEPSSIDDKLLEDEILANNLNEIAIGATKAIHTKYDSRTVPDYSTRLNALKIQLQIKWHFKEKSKRSELPAWIYIFTK